MDVEQMSDPKRHPFKTNGFPVEQCLTCGWPEDAHSSPWTLLIESGQGPDGKLID